LDYLKKLNILYNKWIDNYREGQVLIVDVDKNNFPEKEEDLGEIINKVDSMLFGLF
jgi:deoxyadenosine/deoxycytidine kinase